MLPVDGKFSPELDLSEEDRIYTEALSEIGHAQGYMDGFNNGIRQIHQLLRERVFETNDAYLSFENPDNLPPTTTPLQISEKSSGSYLSELCATFVITPKSSNNKDRIAEKILPKTNKVVAQAVTEQKPAPKRGRKPAAAAMSESSAIQSESASSGPASVPSSVPSSALAKGSGVDNAVRRIPISFGELPIFVGSKVWDPLANPERGGGPEKQMAAGEDENDAPRAIINNKPRTFDFHEVLHFNIILLYNKDNSGKSLVSTITTESRHCKTAQVSLYVHDRQYIP